MATYNSSYTGAQIDAAVAFGMAPDITPTSGSARGVTSGGVYVALRNLPDELRLALLNLAQNVAYVNGNGQTYYNDLYNALYAGVGVNYITAVYTPSGVVFTDDSLDSLRSKLVVTAHYADGSDGVVDNYILSGTLTSGTSTLTVTYVGKTTTVNITNVIDFYNNANWSWPSDNVLVKVNGTFVAPAAGNNNTIRINDNSPYGGSMRVFAVERGNCAVFKHHSDSADTSYYPIPIPQGANYCVASVEPSTIYTRWTMVEYYSSTQKYYSQSSALWGQGSASGSLASVTGARYLVPTIKATSDGETAFLTEPTSFTVTFSQV